MCHRIMTMAPISMFKQELQIGCTQKKVTLFVHFVTIIPLIIELFYRTTR